MNMAAPSQVLYIDMDNVLVDFRSAIPRLLPQELADHEKHFDDIPGIFAKMDPMPGAVDAFHELAELFDTYILSTAPWKNPSAWSDKLLWVKRYLREPATKRLILTHHKNLNRGDFIVDDRTGHGVAEFQGKHIQFGSERFPDWAATLPYLRGKAK